jgi:hypothetical protein
MKEAGSSMTPGMFRKGKRVRGKHASDARRDRGDGTLLVTITTWVALAAAAVSLLTELLALHIH